MKNQAFCLIHCLASVIVSQKKIPKKLAGSVCDNFEGIFGLGYVQPMMPICFEGI